MGAGLGAGCWGEQAGTGAVGRGREGRDRQAGARGRAGHAGAAGAGGGARQAGWDARGAPLLGARPVSAGWPKLVHCAPGSVLTRFFTQFWLSTVPESIFGEIFFKKKYIFEIKIELK